MAGCGRQLGRRLVKPAGKPEPLSPEQRLLMLDNWLRSGSPAGDIAAMVGICKSSLFPCRKRFERHGPAGLMDHPKGESRFAGHVVVEPSFFLEASPRPERKREITSASGCGGSTSNGSGARIMPVTFFTNRRSMSGDGPSPSGTEPAKRRRAGASQHNSLGKSVCACDHHRGAPRASL
jgi:hypothetical protein